MAYNYEWDNDLIEKLRALMKREEGDGYGTMKTPMFTESLGGNLYAFVDRFGIDREVVAIAVNYVDRYFHQNMRAFESDEVNRIILASTLLAIKTNKSSMSDEDANTYATYLCEIAIGDERPTVAAVLEMEKEMLQALDWRLHVPTTHQFAACFADLHPLLLRDTASVEYIHEVTQLQVELALFHPELMVNYKPSVIAYAALLRAEEQIDPQMFPSYEMRDQFHSLHDILGLDYSHVGEAMSALENLTSIPNPAGYEAIKRGQAEMAEAVVATRIAQDEFDHGDVSPRTVAGH